MPPVILAELEASGAAKADGRRLTFVVHAGWCAPGEDRLGYAGVVRLVECVRELHWRLDIACRDAGLDSITRAIDVQFIKPLLAGTTVVGEYAVERVSRRSYVLGIVLHDGETSRELARCRLVSVFFDPVTGASKEPPQPVVKALRALAGRGHDPDRVG